MYFFPCFFFFCCVCVCLCEPFLCRRMWLCFESHSVVAIRVLFLSLSFPHVCMYIVCVCVLLFFSLFFGLHCTYTHTCIHVCSLVYESEITREGGIVRRVLFVYLKYLQVCLSSRG
ncbi:hypothetical protein TCDM_04549 [Trypanosoma cruzi Dm28c]|uniref:Uncharacterized protein n=1 Tax=Trypanosoma cruzi Dm28c TaxID=1416333 RepID=V5BG69_TRYCR|nr:hypothetical protein TCDM_04549 [Trypanosoma cruzi Dm28c]